MNVRASARVLCVFCSFFFVYFLLLLLAFISWMWLRDTWFMLLLLLIGRIHYVHTVSFTYIFTDWNEIRAVSVRRLLSFGVLLNLFLLHTAYSHIYCPVVKILYPFRFDFYYQNKSNGPACVFVCFLLLFWIICFLRLSVFAGFTIIGMVGIDIGCDRVLQHSWKWTILQHFWTLLFFWGKPLTKNTPLKRVLCKRSEINTLPVEYSKLAVVKYKHSVVF